MIIVLIVNESSADRAKPRQENSPTSPLQLLTPVRPHLSAAVLCQLLGTLAALAPVIALAGMVRTVSTSPQGSLTGWVALAIGGELARAALLASALTLSHRADQKLQYALRTQLVQALKNRPLTYFDSATATDVKRTVSDDVGRLHHLIGHSVLDAVSAITTVIGAGVAVLVFAPVLAPFAALPLVVGFALTRVAHRRIAASMGSYMEATAVLDNAMTEYVDGQHIARYFGMGGRTHDRYQDAARSYARIVHPWATSLSTLLGCTQMVYSPLVALASVTVGAWTMQNWAAPQGTAVDIGTFAAAALIAPALTAPMSALAFTLQDISQGRASLERIAKSLDVPEPTAPSFTPLAPEGDPVHLTAQHIALTYPGKDVPAFQDVSFTLRPGRTVAVVGPSGSGKSSVAQVIAGLRPPSAGRITVNGRDRAQLNDLTVLEQVAYAPQEPVMLSTSVRDNLLLGNPDASAQLIDDIVAACDLTSVLADLPQSMATELGGHHQLSGGQAQRLGLARTLLCERPVVVLDEATSALDEATQERVLSAMQPLLRKRSVLIVAHRLATVRHADEILVMSGGQVVQRGTHDELVAQPGTYRTMWLAQQDEELTGAAATSESTRASASTESSA